MNLQLFWYLRGISFFFEFVFFTLACPVVPNCIRFSQGFSVGLMTSHVRHQLTNMAARDVRAAGGCYGDPHLVQVDELISDTQSKSTHEFNKYTIKLVYDYCMSKEYDKDFENSETSDLDKLLKELYFNIRRINGEYYNRSS